MRCALRHIYGDGALQMKMAPTTFQTASGKNMEITALESKYHIEIRPSDAGIHDRIVVQKFIKEAAENHLKSGRRNFKVIVIHEAHRLSFDAQSALRRTMEKHSSRCKLFLCCTDLHKIMDPLVSRCVPIRIANPDTAELTAVLKNVAQKGKYYNNRQVSLMMFDATVTKGGKKMRYDDCRVVIADHKAAVSNIVNTLMSRKTVDSVQLVRNKFYDLINALVPMDVLFDALALEMSMKVATVDEQLLIFESAAEFQHLSLHGDKPVLYLESFVLQVLTNLVNRL
ncbi:unnamed protein product [Bursaphelenchus okinawaensis]|uniref:Replication factor C C-terminal domain-containing protein n=1 Tax=Bursaphelenchus okinawaensis TaxID=465554 RepID=A0A811LLY6_9BILA|nr:unnamed protein product [Bursaphelenchus okinawaensis]CAG9124887.1 unnamed protein product [Bursaphelenchus okinawaensis]